MAALDGETPSSLVVAIEPILGTVMYEARSHYHQVLEDVITSSVHSVTYRESVYICLEKDQVNIMFKFEEMGSDKISTSLVESGLFKTRIGRNTSASMFAFSGKPRM